MATLVSAAAGVGKIELNMDVQRLMEIPRQKGVPEKPCFQREK
jgi:hypothetical protein